MAADDESIDMSLFSKENLKVAFEDLTKRLPGLNAGKIDSNSIGVFVSVDVHWNDYDSSIYLIYTAIAIAKVIESEKYIIIDIIKHRVRSVREYVNTTILFIKNISKKYDSILGGVSYFVAYEMQQSVERFCRRMELYLKPSHSRYIKTESNIFMMPDLTLFRDEQTNRHSSKSKFQNTGQFKCHASKKVLSFFNKLIKNKSFYCLMDRSNLHFRMLKSQFTTLDVMPDLAYMCDDDEVNDDLIHLLIHGCYVMSKHMDAISEREMETRMEKLSLKPNAVKDDEDIDA